MQAKQARELAERRAEKTRIEQAAERVQKAAEKAQFIKKYVETKIEEEIFKCNQKIFGAANQGRTKIDYDIGADDEYDDALRLKLSEELTKQGFKVEKKEYVYEGDLDIPYYKKISLRIDW